MPLTDLNCRTAKANEKPVKMSDGGGLFLLVQPNGSKLWRQAYRYDGKQKLLSLGSYPSTSLADARSARESNKRLLTQSIDPAAQRKLAKGRVRFLARTHSSWSRKNCWRNFGATATTRRR